MCLATYIQFTIRALRVSGNMTISLPGALRRIYDMLKEKKMTIEEIASAAGIKKDTARK